MTANVQNILLSHALRSFYKGRHTFWLEFNRASVATIIAFEREPERFGALADPSDFAVAQGRLAKMMGQLHLAREEEAWTDSESAGR